MTRSFGPLAVLALVLGALSLVSTPGAAARLAHPLADPLVLEASATSVPYARSLTLTATLAAPQPGAEVDFYAKVAGAQDRVVGSAATGSGPTTKVSVTVVDTAAYYAVLVVGGAATAQSAPVRVVVAPSLTLRVEHRLGPVNLFVGQVRPAVDGIPVVLQKKAGKTWQKVEKALTEDGEVSWSFGVPADTTTKWRLYVRGSKKYGAATSRPVPVTDLRLASA